MKKLAYLFLFVALATSCRKSDDTTTTPEVSIETQNSYDDAAITKFLEDNYFDEKGNVVAFKADIATDDNYPKLSSYNPVKLPSGVMYVVRPNAQPAPGQTILENDAIKIMMNSTTYLASKGTDGVMSLSSAMPFRNTIAIGSLEVDPSYFYVKKSVVDKYNATNTTTKDKNFFEIEGFKEALLKFKSFNNSDSDFYNLQGVVLVPSRAAFARDEHFNYAGYTFKDRTFVFNFQVYNRTDRATAGN